MNKNFPLTVTLADRYHIRRQFSIGKTLYLGCFDTHLRIPVLLQYITKQDLTKINKIINSGAIPQIPQGNFISLPEGLFWSQEWLLSDIEVPLLLSEAILFKSITAITFLEIIWQFLQFVQALKAHTNMVMSAVASSSLRLATGNSLWIDIFQLELFDCTAETGNQNYIVVQFKEFLKTFSHQKDLEDLISSLMIQDDITSVVQIIRNLYWKTTNQPIEERFSENFRQIIHLTSIGLAHYHFDLFPEAIHYFTQAIESSQQQYAWLLPSLYVNRGKSYLSNQNIADGVNDLSYATDLQSDLPIAYCALGNIFLVISRYDAALRHFAQSIGWASGYLKPRAEVAFTYAKQGRYTDALREIELLIEQYPEQFYLHFRQALIYEYLQDYNNALVSYYKSLELKSDHIMTYIDLSNLLVELKQFNKAKEYFDFAIEISPFQSELYYNRGVCFEQWGYYNQAIDDYRQASENLYDASSVFNIGNIYFHQSMYDHAILYYREAIKRNPSHEKAHINLGNAYMQTKKLNEAENIFSKAIKLNSNSLMGYFNRATVRRYLKKYEAALADYTEAQRIAPENMQVRTTKAMLETELASRVKIFPELGG